MVNVKLIGKRGSKACKEIRAGADIRGYTGKTKIMPDAIVNYGLPSAGLNAFHRKYPSARNIPTVNRNIGYSKYSVCQRAIKKDIPVPKTKMSLVRADDKTEWIEKRTKSIGGIGICLARGKGSIPGKYYQEFISKRRYELRVHAFLWIPQEEWRIQKRLGSDDVIAWNYKNGGHFVSVHRPRSFDTFIQAEAISEKIMKMLGMSFGAVDFLVDVNQKLYFIEINAAPGFTELSKPIYVDAFTKLKSLGKKTLLKFAT